MENEESQASEDCSLLTEICVKESDCETEEKPKKRWFQQPFTWLIIVISFIILLLIGYFLIIPLIINSVIKHAPPIQVQNVAFVKLNRNKTLQMELYANLPMNAVPSRFHQSDYTLSFGGPTSVIGPFFNLSSESDSIITQLGFVKMSPFDLDWKPVHLELNGLLFNHDLHQLQTLINFVATAGIGRLVSSFSSFLSLYEEAERKVSSRINKFDKNVFHRYFDNSRQYISNMVSGYSIVMHGKPKANIFGILFRGIDVSYTLPLRFDMNNIVKLMNISFDYSVIEDETFSKFGSKLLQIVFDEPMGMIPFYNIQLTFLNPTPISLNLGQVEFEFHWLQKDRDSIPIAKLNIPSLRFDFTSKSKTVYQSRNCTLYVASEYLLTLIQMYGKGTPIGIGLSGKNIKFFGYQDEDTHQDGRLEWAEELFHQIDIKLSLVNATNSKQ